MGPTRDLQKNHTEGWISEFSQFRLKKVVLQLRHVKMNISLSEWTARRGRVWFGTQLSTGQQQESEVIQLMKQEWVRNN